MYSMTIIVPVYRVEKFLRKCLDSVLAQTIKDIEVIIVDDGSDDNSGAIADEYAERYPHISCIHKENGGLASARSSGLEVASGEYIAFLDSDDWVDDYAYETLYRIATEHNKPDIIVYRSHGERNSFHIPATGYYDRAGIEKEILPYVMPSINADGKLHYLRFSNCMKIYKRSFLEESGIYYHDGILIMEDVLFSLECIDRARSYYYTDEELYYITENPNSLSRTPYNRNKTESMLKISECIRAYKDRKQGYDYGDHIYSAILFFLEEGITNELKAPSIWKAYKGIHKILSSDVCRWYIQEDKPTAAGWYGRIQKNIETLNAFGMIYDLKYKSKCKKTFRKVRKAIFRR